MAHVAEGTVPSVRWLGGDARCDRRTRLRTLSMTLAFLVLNLSWRALHHRLTPACVFVVYPGTEQDKRLYVPA